MRFTLLSLAVFSLLAGRNVRAESPGAAPSGSIMRYEIPVKTSDLNCGTEISQEKSGFLLQSIVCQINVAIPFGADEKIVSMKQVDRDGNPAGVSLTGLVNARTNGKQVELSLKSWTGAGGFRTREDAELHAQQILAHRRAEYDSIAKIVVVTEVP